MTALRLMAALCICLAATLSGAQQKHALVIGVDAVPNFRVGGLMAVRPLRGAEYDARTLSDALINYWAYPHRHVQLLLGADANCAAVEAAMERLCQEAKPEDSVLIYFAGHGTQVPDRAPFDEPPEERLDEALCLSDATSDGKNLLLDDDLGALLRRLKVRGITIMLDCCHSGTGVKGSEEMPVERGITMPSVARLAMQRSGGDAWREFETVRKAGGPRVVALYACQANQSAYERRFDTAKGPQPMGQFTRFLLQAMRDPRVADADGDGLLTVSEAAGFVSDQINHDFNAGRPDPKHQTPHFDAARVTWALDPSS